MLSPILENQELHRIDIQYGLPEFVKFAYEQDAATVTGQSQFSADYADPRTRNFSCHTGAATWRSAVRFFEKQAEFHPTERKRIEQRLMAFANHHGVKAAVESAKRRYEELNQDETEKLADDAFGYVWVDEEVGKKNRHLPLRNAAEVKRASEWLLQYRDDLEFADRHVIATKILDRAIKCASDLGENWVPLEQMAARGICDGAEVAAALRQRSRLVKDAAEKENLRELAQLVEKQPDWVFVPEQMFKLAEIIDTLDRKLGVVGKYTSIIQRPEEILFGVSHTKAANWMDEHCSLQTGSVYRASDFGQLELDNVRALLGNGIADAVADGVSVSPEKMAEIASTLPLADAALLDRLLDDTGVRPTHKQAARASTGYTFAELHKIATLSH